MMILFDQNIKYYNQDNKILHLVSHVALQTAPLIGTTKPSNSVPSSSDRNAQFLIASNFEKIWNMEKILVHVTRFNICDCT